MAYSDTVTIKPPAGTPRHKGQFITIEIAETEAGTATESTITLSETGERLVFKVHRVVAQKTAGSASTLAPLLGKATNPSGDDVVIAITAAAPTIDETPDPPSVYWTDTGILYHRTVCDTGSDNTTAITYILELV